MNIRMTIAAALRQLCERQMGSLQIARRFSVTGPAGRIGMSANQRIICSGMIKFYLPPAFNRVAKLTPFFSKSFFDRPVRIGVAAGTTIGGEGETDSFFYACANGSMTGNTRDGKMGAHQRIIGFLVLGQRESRWRKPFHCVAFLAGSAQRAAGKAAPVIIGMAIHTLFKP